MTTAPVINSTPTPKAFPVCWYCSSPGSFGMRDASGGNHYACGDHTHRMESDVRLLNGWDPAPWDLDDEYSESAAKEDRRNAWQGAR